MSAVEDLSQAELFTGLSETARLGLTALARRRAAAAGEVLFRLGDPAEEFYVLRHGRVELTFPLVVMGETKEARFQSLEAGRTLGWSALVPPFRYTMSARASTDVELLGFARSGVLRLFDEQPAVGYPVMTNLSHVVATRLHELIALWVREVQRNVSQTFR